MPNDTFDLIILGTGPAASRVADKCAEAGWKLAIIENRAFGGTCALRGCNPKKVLVRAAELADWTQRAHAQLTSGPAEIDWPALIDFEQTFTAPIPDKSRTRFQELGIETILGDPEFVTPDTLQVGQRRLTAKHFLLATGAIPRSLEIPGQDMMLTSDQFLNLEQLPKRLVFIGGGYIAFEFAHIAARAGANVTILEKNARCLSPFDSQLVDKLVSHSQQHKIHCVTNAQLKSIENSNGTMLVHYEHAGTADSLECDAVINAAGRVPNLGNLNLKAAEIEATDRGVKVDDFLRSTSNHRVHAAGDCADTQQPRLTPIANQQARTIAKNLRQGSSKFRPDYGPVPSAVYTIPALASVGLTEEQAIVESIQYEVLEGDMSKWGSMRKVQQSCAHFRILIDPETRIILGAHLLGPPAAEQINLFAMAMKFGISAPQMKSVLFTFPSFTADIRSML